MSDTCHDAQMPLPSQPGIPGPSGAGMLLREARERARLDAGALSSMLKVPRARIESLEAGRFDDLPDGVYARSLASSICRALRIDASPVLALLPHAGARPLDSVAEHKATRIKSASNGARGKFAPSARASTHVSRRALALSALFVMAAGFVVLAPQGAFDKLRSALPAWGDASTGGERRTAEIVNGPGVARVVEEVPVSSGGGGAAQPAVSSDAAVAGTGPATPGGFAITPVAPAPVAPAADALAVPAMPAAAADRSAVATNSGGLLVISASAPTWIKVADAKGAVLVQKTLGAGQVESVADAATPLSVTVGRTDTTTVQVRGEAFDLSARARNNVARFEVK